MQRSSRAFTQIDLRVRVGVDKLPQIGVVDYLLVVRSLGISVDKVPFAIGLVIVSDCPEVHFHHD
ncbi:hypothetical protein [Limnospira platensis]|uniref:Uncharacterized protein n=1 Tax=Limnospira indica PCC 8005 TaxID=376219 RepID=A0A9P1KKM5_9CYAN|nr:conserved protein of unknown function [Limnospira indica PCC 8005]